jgi:hypothetical protein
LITTLIHHTTELLCLPTLQPRLASPQAIKLVLLLLRKSISRLKL